MSTINETIPATVATLTLPDFGKTRYSSFGLEVFRDAKRLMKVSGKQAERIALAAMADLGRINASVSEIRIGKVNKDGQVTIREVARVKSVLLTQSLRCVKLLALLQECRSWGVQDFLEFELDPTLQEWIGGTTATGNPVV